MKTFAKSLLVTALVLLFASSDLTAQLARQWVARFNGGLKKKSNGATALAVDNAGNVIVVGWVTRSVSGVDFATVKYKSDGTYVGAAYFDGTGTGEDRAVAVAVDTGKNIYVTGYASNSGAGFDIVTIKYDSNLAVAAGWPKTYNGPGNADDKPVSIAVNDSLNVYVTGTSVGSGTGADYVTVKYDAGGAQQWVQRYNGKANLADSAFAMVLQGTTALYVTGTTRDSLNSSTVTYDYKTIKYDAGSGDTLWTARYKGDGDDIARSIALRSSNDVFVTGSSHTDTSGWDYLTIKYNQSDGGEAWVSRYNDPSNGDDNAYVVGASNSGGGRVFVSGRSLNAGSFNDMVTIRYNVGDGSENWVSSYNGTANDDDGGVSMAAGNSPYVLGPSMGAGVRLDYALVQYSSNGNQNSVNRYNGIGNFDDVPAQVHTGSGGAVYVTGYSAPADKGTDMLTIKYVDQNNLRYRTFSQTDYMAAAVNLKSGDPNPGNVRDEAFAKAYPKIKKGFAGYPGGMVIGQARPDSNTSYGWMRFDKGKNIIKFFPQTGPSSGFDLLLDSKPFLGEKKNLKLTKYNNHLVGEMVALRLNIGASDAEVTPPTFGDLTYNDTTGQFDNMTIREIASMIDNYLTYWKKYPGADTLWQDFDTVVTRVNRAFLGSTSPLAYVSRSPLEVTGVNPVDSVDYLQSAIAPLVDPLAFPEGSVDNTVPRAYALNQNYPNPFNPTTTIEFDLPEPAVVTLLVYNILGQQVATLLDQEDVSEGLHEVEFSANALASGVYFYRVVALDEQLEQVRFQQIRKMVLLK